MFVHGCAATPLTLLDALAKHGVDAKLKDVELIHIHTEGPGFCVQPEYDGAVSLSLFRDNRKSWKPIFVKHRNFVKMPCFLPKCRNFTLFNVFTTIFRF